MLFPKKKLSNTEYDFNSKIYKNNTKKNEKNKKEKNENLSLSSAYKNINLLLTNCLESIRNEENNDETINSPILKSVSGLIRRKHISPRKINKMFKNTISKKPFALSKSNSLSNSNTVLIKSSEDNYIKSLNIDNEPQKKSIFHKNTSSLKINKKKTNISQKSYHINQSNLDEKSGLKSPKKINSKSTKFLFSQNKDDGQTYNKINTIKGGDKKQPSLFNMKELKKIFTIHTKNTNASLKTNKTILPRNNKSNKKIDFLCDNLKYSSNVEVYSPKSIKMKNTKKNKKVTFHAQKFKRRKNKLNTLEYLSNKYNQVFGYEKTKTEKGRHSSKKSVLSEDKNNLNNSIKNNNELKRPKTVIIPTKIYDNILGNYVKKKSTKNFRPLKNSKKSLKILTLEQIGENVKQSLIGFNLSEVKKELYNLENNDISEAIKNLPTKKFGTNELDNNNEKYISKKESNNFNDDKNNSSEINSKKSEEWVNNNIDRYQQKYRKLFLMSKVYDSLDDEEIGDEEINNFYLSPYSTFIYIIDTLVFIVSFIELFYLPIFLGYKKNFCRDILSFESLLFYSIDLIYIIDLIIGFFRAYYDFEELLIKDNIDIIIHYLKGWFTIDLIEAIPLYTIFSFHEEKCSKNNTFYLYNIEKNNLYYSFLIIKILKIFKAFYHNSSMNKIIHLLNSCYFFSNWNDVVFTLLVTLSLIHFCSCFFIYLGRNFYSGWITIKGIQDNSYLNIYIAAIYYLMTTLTTVGYGDITVYTTYERIYQIILLIVGTCAYSWIVTYISNYIKKMNEKYLDFENKLKILSDIKMSYPLLKNDLYEKVIRYLKYNKDENKYNVDYILDSLPLSLKNNVIIDMYKPIIKNFLFFKSFQNSDFFVKIVTSLKPVLSMKDDILVQEGDVIEDIIFIKNGVLSLEICIDLDCPQESCEAHLDGKGLATTLDHLQTVKNSLASSNINYSKSKIHTLIKNNNLISNKKDINIINLRKNEHYGDILMILNERSPLTVKVKSKKAELFFLQKTEATEISNKYPNIWKRIVHKSLFNMKQIKNLIKKKIIIFCDLNGIFINEELRKNINLDISDDPNFFTDIINKNNNLIKNNSIKYSFKNDKKKGNLKYKNHINTIIYEEDENTESNRNSYIRTSLNNITKNLNSRFSGKKEKYSEMTNLFSSNNVKSGLKSFLNKSNISNNSFKKEKKDDKKESLLVFNSNTNSNSNSITTSKNKKIKSDSLSKEEKHNLHENNKEKEIFFNNKSDKNFNLLNKKINKMLTAMEEKMKPNNSQINNLNINVYTYKTVNYPKNNINRRYSGLSESVIVKKKYKYEDEDNEVNEEIYSDENFNINIDKEKIYFNNSDKNNNILYPYLNNYFEEKNNTNLNLSKLLEKDKDKLSDIRHTNNENSKISKNSDLLKSSRFSNLYTTTSISFSINSLYENMNKLTGYRLKDIYLQKKIKNYILDECFFQTNSINYHKNNNFHSNSPQERMRSIKNNETAKRNSRNSNSSSMIARNSSYLGVSKFNEEKTKKIKLRNSLKIRKKRIFSTENPFFVNQFENQRSIEIQKYPKKTRKSINMRPLTNNNNMSFLNYSNISNRKIYLQQDDNLFFKKKTSKRTMKINDDEEMSFYTRMKTIRNNKNKNYINNNSFIAKPQKFNLMDQISQNIQKNKQNLNNPEEYFSGFFSNILQRKKTIYRKPVRMSKKASYSNIKRTSTSSEVINRNNINNKFNI